MVFGFSAGKRVCFGGVFFEVDFAGSRLFFLGEGFALGGLILFLDVCWVLDGLIFFLGVGLAFGGLVFFIGVVVRRSQSDEDDLVDCDLGFQDEDDLGRELLVDLEPEPRRCAEAVAVQESRVIMSSQRMIP